MNIVKGSIEQPITVSVGIILALLAGYVAFTRVPVQLAPEVEETVISVTTTWENASPQEIETEVVDEQEERLQSVENLVSMTSVSQESQGQIRLQFRTGTNKDNAMREVSDKLREVPSYPLNVDEPIIEDTDPETRDYIAWIVMVCTDPNYDITTLFDAIDNRLKPRFERLPGVAEVNVLGGVEREVQIRVDTTLLAQRGISMNEFREALVFSNNNYSGGALQDGKTDIRIRAVGRFRDVKQVEEIVVKQSENGPIYIRDVADVVETYKERTSKVRSRGRDVLAINFQREIGSNVIAVMEGILGEVERVSEENGLLDTIAKSHNINGKLELELSYNQTTYIDQALLLVRNNILLGGTLATFTLLLFLRSLRSIGIIAIAIPISVIGSIVFLVALGRTVNVISLAGMAFAVGMVVDNSIVVLENIYRHLEMGKKPVKAAYDGASEVAGAVLASTLTTIVVFIPVLLIEEQSGQLFRDIALAICAAVGLSFIVSVTVIPSASSRWLNIDVKPSTDALEKKAKRFSQSFWSFIFAPIRMFLAIPTYFSSLVKYVVHGYVLRFLVITVFIGVSLVGTYLLFPPIDYLPQGNRNIVFGLMIPPPGYNIDMLSKVGMRIEERMRPAWEAHYNGTDVDIPPLSTGFTPDAPQVIPPPVRQYFLVVNSGSVFHGAISAEDDRVVDIIPAFQYATSSEVAPGFIAFAFQLPLFRLGGTTGSAVKIDLIGANLDSITSGADALYGRLVQEFGPYSIQPEPSNFNIPRPEIQVFPDTAHLTDLGLTVDDLGLTVQVASDGAFIGEYEITGELVDLKLISKASVDQESIEWFGNIPLATPNGTIVSLDSISTIQRVAEPDQIKRVGRQRAVTLQLTPPPGMPLQSVIESVQSMIRELRGSNVIPSDVETSLVGTASKLDEIQTALLGKGTISSTISSSLFLALFVVYLLMCVLFQSWIYPLVIMLSVPLATFGGFLALSGVHYWSVVDRYMPVQNLDVLTILGFIILAGVVVNNAILIVYQTLNFLEEIKEESDSNWIESAKEAISRAVESRVRPIMMSTLTSIGGMLPLVLMPGSGSELYRGLGSVVVGGLLVSTLFTLILVPVVLSVLFDMKWTLRGKQLSH